MRALHTAVLYFGTFLLVGWWAKSVLDKWMAEHSESLTEVQRQAGDERRKQPRFLLGVWRK
jgi:hypothetical protein